MDQVKIGRFIAEMRKQQNLTQREFADALGISDKTISKWECGNGLPDLSFMQSICKILKIDLNELFSGEKLTDAEYKKKAEENMLTLVKEAEKIKKNIVGGRILGCADNIELNVSKAHKQGVNATLICSPMEEACELPTDYFDLIYSVYGIGWTTNLDKTFKHIHSYLKKDGIFVFGWSHPIHKCVSVENGKLIFSNSYFNETWYRAHMSDKEIMLSNRMLSTYINTLADNGFVIEKLIEETDREKAAAANNDFGRKALMLPTVFVIRARKNSNIYYD